MNKAWVKTLPSLALAAALPAAVWAEEACCGQGAWSQTLVEARTVPMPAPAATGLPPIGQPASLPPGQSSPLAPVARASAPATTPSPLKPVTAGQAVAYQPVGGAPGALQPVAAQQASPLQAIQGTPVLFEHGGCNHCGGHGCQKCPGPPLPVCTPPIGQHATTVFAESLLLRPGNTDYIYAIQTDEPDIFGVTTGPVGNVEPEHEAGFAVGGALCLSDVSSIAGVFRRVESEDENSITAPGEALLWMPFTDAAIFSDIDPAFSSATMEVEMMTADFEFRHLIWGSRHTAIHWHGGGRYGHLEQDFESSVITGSILAPTQMFASSKISFDGVGIRSGFLGEARSCQTGLLLYGKTSASLLAGEIKAEYEALGTGIALEFDDYRVSPVLEAEMGFGWENVTGRFRITGGYQFAGWFNQMNTASLIEGRAAFYDLDNITETITFDGFALRVEWRR